MTTCTLSFGHARPGGLGQLAIRRPSVEAIDPQPTQQVYEFFMVIVIIVVMFIAIVIVVVVVTAAIVGDGVGREQL